MAIHFGQYDQIHEEETPYNSTKTCTWGNICIVTRVNKQGGFKFMTLGSMKKVVRKIWYATLMPATVVARVKALSQGQPNDLSFFDSNKHPIGELDITGVNAGET